MSPPARFPASNWRRSGLAVFLALWLSACGNQVELMASLPESEANEVLAALLNAGIAARKISGKEGMVGLSVEASELGRAVDLLHARGLPRERAAGMGEIFKKEGLISSPLEERARYLYALSQELRGTIGQIDGVIVARVHVVLSERGSAGDPNTPSSAAVFIKHQEAYNLDTVQPQIRKLVTNSIPGLAPERVSIVTIAAQPPPAKSGEAPASAGNGGTARTWPAAALASTLALLALLIASLAAIGFFIRKYGWPTRTSRQPPEKGSDS